MRTRSFSFRGAIHVFNKDIRSELRTRYAINALLMFVLTTISMILFAIGNEDVPADVLSGVLWVVIFFSSMSGMSQTFVAEEERGTVMILQLTTKPLTVYFGKLLFNIVLLSLLTIVAIALYILVIDGFVVRSFSIFVLTVVLGTLGLACASTIIAAIIAKANMRGALFTVLAFPILLPLLLTVINGTRLAVEGVEFQFAIDELKTLVSYLVVMLTLSFLLFEFIWRE